MTFIHDDFLLQSEPARALYHQFAATEPILDYHNHLPAGDVASNRQFANLFEIWLEGDHYKWRAMRANGEAEAVVTGNATPKEKFLAWARTVPHTLRNPLYHWTHLELKRYFDIDELLSPESAERIWELANERLTSPDRSTQGILREWRVRALCTTDDPCDTLEHHQAVNASGAGFRMYPTFRPDKALGVDHPEHFNPWCDRLAAAADLEIQNLADLQEALRRRHDFFHDCGGRLSDRGLESCFADFCAESTAAGIFERTRNGQAASPEEHRQFASNLMLFLGQLDAEKDWTMQMHIGAMRNNNSRFFRELGPDTGFDSIGDASQGVALSNFLSKLDEHDRLPKTVLYNLNPADNYLFATMIGNFQDGSTAGKIQFGSGWWFLDQKEAMEWQINALSNNGLLSRFIGMLTDSRSFMSLPRHEYFRRTLCNLLGTDMELGLLPDDPDMVGTMVRKICYGNVRDYLGLEI